jgi:hypothetical protein
MSAAFVAVTLHVPNDVELSEPLEIEQPVAVPFVAENVTAPSPVPPVVVSSNGVPKVPAVLETARAGICGVRAAHCAYNV